MLLVRFNPCGVCQFSYDGLVFYPLPGSDCGFLISMLALAWLYKVEGGINCLGASFGIVTVQAEYNILYY